MAKNETSLPVWLRRVSQTVFMVLFLYLFLQTAFHPGNVRGSRVTFFFEVDPLVLLTTWLGGQAVPRAMLLSLITLAVTLVFGRWFCGWFCPFGALHNMFTGQRDLRKKQKLERGGYSNWQKAKYYVLILVLVTAIVGPNLAGWLDPFSFFYRSLTTAVFPVTNAGLHHLFEWIYRVDPGVGPVRLTVVSEPVYHWLRNYLLVLGEPHFIEGMLIGVLFIVVVALNFYRARFWCRYICPLGALLGLVGKNPIVRLKTDLDECNDCKLCRAECQGGANPESQDKWKPAECFFCWNCHSTCPGDTVTFNFQFPALNNPVSGPDRKEQLAVIEVTKP